MSSIQLYPTHYVNKNGAQWVIPIMFIFQAVKLIGQLHMLWIIELSNLAIYKSYHNKAQSQNWCKNYNNHNNSSW